MKRTVNIFDVVKNIDKVTEGIHNTIQDIEKSNGSIDYSDNLAILAMWKRELEDQISRIEKRLPYVTKFAFGFQCTHTDADGLGSVIPVAAIDAINYKSPVPTFTLYYPCAEYKSDYLIKICASIFRQVVNDEPDHIIISDISMDKDTYSFLKIAYPHLVAVRELSPMEYGNLETEVIPFLCVDHHATNPYLNNTEEKFLIAPMYEDLEKLIEWTVYKVIPNEMRYLEPHKISATFIMCVVCNNLYRSIYDYHRPDKNSLDPKVKDNYQTLINRSIDTLNDLSLAISDWDTFEWRDHPRKAYRPLSPVEVGNLGFSKNPIKIFEPIINYIWTQGFRDVPITQYLPDALMDDIRMADAATEAIVNATMEKGKWIQTNLLSEIDNWFVFGFPTVGNASVICHYIMESEMYQEKRKEGTCGIIMLDLYTDTVSFRTTEEIDVARVDTIAKWYGGGGHPQASGCRNASLADKLKTELINKSR